MVLPPIKMIKGPPKSSKKVPLKTEAIRFRPKELSIGTENQTVCNIIPQIQTPKVKLRPDLQLVNSNISVQKNIRVISRDQIDFAVSDKKPMKTENLDIHEVLNLQENREIPLVNEQSEIRGDA